MFSSRTAPNSRGSSSHPRQAGLAPPSPGVPPPAPALWANTPRRPEGQEKAAGSRSPAAGRRRAPGRQEIRGTGGPHCRARLAGRRRRRRGPPAPRRHSAATASRRRLPWRLRPLPACRRARAQRRYGQRSGTNQRQGRSGAVAGGPAFPCLQGGEARPDSAPRGGCPVQT